ncbi:hypothetical protein [Nocardia aobensis]|nr:hypothetical protein [Nocardia aobensis]
MATYGPFIMVWGTVFIAGAEAAVGLMFVAALGLFAASGSRHE